MTTSTTTTKVGRYIISVTNNNVTCTVPVPLPPFIAWKLCSKKKHLIITLKYVEPMEVCINLLNTVRDIVAGHGRLTKETLWNRFYDYSFAD